VAIQIVICQIIAMKNFAGGLTAYGSLI
jgi:hypothetical protein